MTPDRPRRPSKGKQSRPKASGIAKGLASTPSSSSRVGPPAQTRINQVIPDAVANRMARRIAIATGLPTVLGMGVFVASYLLVSRHILNIPPSTTLLASGACFLLGLVGLSYGVLSASWEEAPGTLFGAEQIPLNISRVKTSLKALREGPQTPGNGPS